MRVLLDTHVWIWWLTGQPDLPARERDALDRRAEAEKPLLSAISVWEAQMLRAKGRLQLSTPFPRWIVDATAAEVVELVPLSAEVVIQLDGLPDRFHGDPADRIIVASAMSRGVPLHTHDSAIRKSRVIPIWKP